MTDAKRRGDPLDGLSGLFALWIVLAAWIEAMAAPPSWIISWTGASERGGALSPVLAIDAYLIICGLMAARAARGGLHDVGDLPRYAFWRALRFAPALAVSLGLFLATEAALGRAGLVGETSFFTANGLALPLLAAFLGSLLVGGAIVSGALDGAIGRAGIAAFAAACVAARLTPGMELTPAADIAARIAAAFALGVFLDSAAASGRVARSIRRIKANNAGGVELAALIAVLCALVLTPVSLLPAAPVAIMGYLLIFARKRGAVSDHFLCAPSILQFGRAAAPMIGCAFLITWPISAYRQTDATDAFDAAVVLSPLFVLAVFGLAFAVRRLAEDPTRAFADHAKRSVADARREIEAERAA